MFKKTILMILVLNVLACSDKSTSTAVSESISTSQINVNETASTSKTNPTQTIYSSYLAQNPSPDYTNWRELEWGQFLMRPFNSPNPRSKDPKSFKMKLPTDTKMINEECVLVSSDENREIIFPLKLVRAYEKWNTQKLKQDGYDVKEAGASYLFVQKMKPLKNHHLGCQYVYKPTSEYRRPDNIFIANWISSGNAYLWSKKEQRFIENISILYFDRGYTGDIHYYIGDVDFKNSFGNENLFYSTMWYIS